MMSVRHIVPRPTKGCSGIGIFSMVGAAMYAALHMSGWLQRVPEVVPELLRAPPRPVEGWAWLRRVFAETADPIPELEVEEGKKTAGGTEPAG